MTVPVPLQDLFLGLDASTQAVKASLLSSTLDIVSEVAVNFDADLPHYKTNGGVLHGPKGSGEVFSPVMLIVEAMDLLFERIKKANWDVSRIRGISAAGQQHASVYWSRESSSILGSLDPRATLTEQLPKAFSRPIVPNWQDSSTTAECRKLEAAFGGAEALARATGSKAYERFTASQIMRFKRLSPEEYDSTDRISLCSSLITTLLCLDGEVKGIDESDACGMNLWRMDHSYRGWHPTALSAIAGEDGAKELSRKLGRVETDGGREVGKVGKWFVERYGFNPECSVFPGTGDNPATLLSLVLRSSEGLISMGTSDVVLVSTSSYNPHPEYHAFFHPAQNAPPIQQSGNASSTGQFQYFNMLVYKNGSLARQHVRDQYYDKSWDKFNSAVEELRPKSSSDLPSSTAFWWLLPDIIPDNASGVHKYSGRRETSESIDAQTATKVEHFPDVRQEALAILESQLLNYRSRSSAILDDSSTPSPASTPAVATANPRLSRVYATGGASANGTILSLMADVLSAPVCKNVEIDPATGQWTFANWNSCSVGVAYKARWGWERLQHGGKRNDVSFDELIGECREARKAARKHSEKEESLEEEGIRVVASPGDGRGAYERSVGWWQALESRALTEQ